MYLGFVLSINVVNAHEIQLFKEGKKCKEIKYENKKILSDDLFTNRSVESSLQTNIQYCDIAVKGEIIGIEKCKKEIRTGTKLDKKLEKEGFPILDYTKYKIKVDDTYIGSTKENIIEYWELGKLDEMVTKPKEKGKVFLFLCKRGKKYQSVDAEHSIFTISDDNELYSFSNTKDLSKYDGKNIKQIDEKLSTETIKESLKMLEMGYISGDFIIYKGNIYRNLSDCYPNTSYKNMSHIIGEYLFTTKGVPSTEELALIGYNVEHAALYGVYDVYSVKGYSDDFRLCRYDKGKDIVYIYDNASYSPKKASGIIGVDGLNLKNMYDENAEVQYQTGNIDDKKYVLKDTSIIKKLIDSINETADVISFNDYKKRPNNGIITYITMKDNTKVILDVYKEGYVSVGCLARYIPIDATLAQQIIDI